MYMPRGVEDNCGITHNTGIQNYNAKLQYIITYYKYITTPLLPTGLWVLCCKDRVLMLKHMIQQIQYDTRQKILHLHMTSSK